MIHDGETIEVGCQFCNKKYPVTVEELKSLLGKKQTLAGSGRKEEA